MGEIRDAIKHGWGEGHKPAAKRQTWDQHKQATAPEPRGIDDVRPDDTEILLPSGRAATTPAQPQAGLDRNVERLFNWSIGLIIAPYILTVVGFFILFWIFYAILT